VSPMSCKHCGKSVSSASGIFVHTDTERAESLENGFHYAKPVTK
jgi:hypothetical protein